MCHNVNHTHKSSLIRGEGWKEGSKKDWKVRKQTTILSSSTVGFPGGASGEELACLCRRQKTQIRSLSQEDPPEEGMATDSNILALRIPRTEEPVKLQYIGSQRIGLDWACTHKNTSVHVYSLSLHFKKNYEPYKNYDFLSFLLIEG